jgi:hypothetical protein
LHTRMEICNVRNFVWNPSWKDLGLEDNIKIHLYPFVPLGTWGICKAPPSVSVLRQPFNLAPCLTTNIKINCIK